MSALRETTPLLSTGTPSSPFSLTAASSSLASAISLSEAVMRTLHLLVVVEDAAVAFPGLTRAAPSSGGTFLGLPRPRFTGAARPGAAPPRPAAAAAA